MVTESHDEVTISRQTFLKGIAGIAAVAAAPSRWIDAVFADPDGSLAARVEVDLGNQTGKTVQPHLYGYATGDLANDDFLLAANGVVESSAKTLAPSLIRFNTSESTIVQTIFANGVTRPNWTHLARWVRHHADFLGKDGRLIFGIGPNDADTALSPATWAEYARATALHFREIGQEITHWEVGNECDPMGARGYSAYFNAVADALHAVNPGYLVGGPVATYWNGINLPAFVSLSGANLGFIDFHSYMVLDADSTRTAYARAAAFSDVRSARRAVAGTVAANLPIGLLEYNMNGFPQRNGTYGLPAQGTITGAVYIALLLTRAFDSDPGFAMGGLWDVITDSYYGAIGNARDKFSFHAIDEQGWYLRQATRLMPGNQARTTQTGSHLQVLATASGPRFSVQLVNYNLGNALSIATTVIGRKPGSPVTRWELSARYPAGHLSTTASLARVPVPPQSIVILTGQRHERPLEEDRVAGALSGAR
jgi:hypothetical protein